MSKRITIVLTDDEYAALEARAQADRRSVREMAARLVTQPATILTIPSVQPNTWIQNGCAACNLPSAGLMHTCMRTYGGWTVSNGTTITASSVSLPPILTDDA